MPPVSKTLTTDNRGSLNRRKHAVGADDYQSSNGLAAVRRCIHEYGVAGLYIGQGADLKRHDRRCGWHEDHLLTALVGYRQLPGPPRSDAAATYKMRVFIAALFVVSSLVSDYHLGDGFGPQRPDFNFSSIRQHPNRNGSHR